MLELEASSNQIADEQTAFNTADEYLIPVTLGVKYFEVAKFKGENFDGIMEQMITELRKMNTTAKKIVPLKETKVYLKQLVDNQGNVQGLEPSEGEFPVVEKDGNKLTAQQTIYVPQGTIKSVTERMKELLRGKQRKIMMKYWVKIHWNQVAKQEITRNDMGWQETHKMPNNPRRQGRGRQNRNQKKNQARNPRKQRQNRNPRKGRKQGSNRGRK
jgi:hypothetical protein